MVLNENDKLMNRLCSLVSTVYHPIKIVCCLNNIELEIETAPCLNMVINDKKPIPPLTASACPSRFIGIRRAVY